MEFEMEGIIFSNEYIPPNIKPFPKIDNYAQFLQKFQKIKDHPKWASKDKGTWVLREEGDNVIISVGGFPAYERIISKSLIKYGAVLIS